jgi:hypothetical protein
MQLTSKEDEVSKAFFNASIRCSEEDGTTTLFWSDPWLEGQCISAQAPDLVAMVDDHCHR